MPKAKTQASEIEKTARQAEALALRRQRLTYEEIGERMGISGPGAFKLVTKALAKYARVSTENAEALREESREDLERLRAALEPMLESTDPMVRGKAVSEAVKIHARMAALYGLDAATKTELTGKDGGPVQVQTWSDVFAEAERVIAERAKQ